MRHATPIPTSAAWVFTLTLALMLGAVGPANAQDDSHQATAADVDVLDVDFAIITPETAEDAAMLIERIEETALDMRQSAARLKSFTRVPDSYSIESHAWRLNQIRENLNDISRTLDRLEENTEFLLPRQRLSVGYVADELPTLAANLKYAIEHMNEQGAPLWVDEYTTPVAQVYDSADTIVEAAGLAEKLSEISMFDDNSDD